MKKNSIIDKPPFYLPVFEETYRYIIDYYIPPHRDIAIFIPCAISKPYSQSPSHKLFHSIFNDVFINNPLQYHVVIFGTCGTVPAELELMYPYAHYHYMLGKVNDKRIKNDFLKIETRRIIGYLEKTRYCYKKRVAYCIGMFREALERAIAETQIDFKIYPTQQTIKKLYNSDCQFHEGSLSMQEYLSEFKEGLIKMRDT